MNKLIIAAFPASAIKFMVQGETEQVDSQKMCWFPEFEENFTLYLEKEYNIQEIYVLGPKNYIPEVVSKIKGLTTLPVIEEGI
jgi:hypothetical protein